MNIMDFFRAPPTSGPVNTQQGQQGQQGQQPNQQGQQSNQQQQPGNGADPNNPLIPAGGGNDTGGGGNSNDQNQSPLAEFNKLWDNTPSKGADGKDITPDDPLNVLPNLQADPTKMYEAAKRVDFSKVMNPERVKAALAGDQAAFGEVINSVAQAAFANSAMANTRIVEAAMKQMLPKLFDSAIPHLVRKHSVKEAVQGDNPIFADPAVAPMLSMLETQLSSKFPQASAREISAMAKKYVSGLGKALTGMDIDNNTNNSNPGARGGSGNKQNSGAGDDWSTFLEPQQQQN